MVTVTGISGGAAGDYYLKLTKESIFHNAGEPPGKWFGKGAHTMLIEGRVKAEDLKAVLNGR